jgi:hypothetical protein
MEKSLLKRLQAQLKHYGLNSDEWTIRPLARNLFQLCHITDPHFKFLGTAKNKNWSQIWLVSI